MTEILFCQMVLISCLAVDGTFSIRLRGYIFFSQAVDNDMGMDITGVVAAVCMSADKCLMPRKICFGICTPSIFDLIIV